MLVPKPWSRVNDRFVRSAAVDATPTTESITHDLIPPFEPRAGDVYQLEIYQQVALDIVAETVFNYPYVYISEKTYRPMMNRRMFVIAGAPGTLSTLHSYGFQTWGDIINEDYDTVQDPEQRLLVLVAAVREFCNLPLCQIQEFMIQHQDRFEHNYQQLVTLEQQCLAQVQHQIGRNLVKQKLKSSL